MSGSQKLEAWPLKTSPADYLARHPDGPNAELARKYLAQGFRKSTDEKRVNENVAIAPVATLRPHPELAKLLPEQEDDVLQALITDIRERIDDGEKFPILYPLVVNERGVVIDGMTRLQIAKELGIKDVRVEVRRDLSDADEIMLGLGLNTDRRQMSLGQKRSLARKLIKRDPEWSDREISRRVGLAPATVGSLRRDMEAKGKVEPTAKRRGAKGTVQKVGQKKGPSKRKRTVSLSDMLTTWGYMHPSDVTTSEARELVKEWEPEHWDRVNEWIDAMTKLVNLRDDVDEL